MEVTEIPCEKPRAKPKVQKEWEEEDVFKLISMVENQVCLWDASKETYHNKPLRDCAWRNIEERFDKKYSAVECSANWSNLRIQFRGYAGRAKTKSGQGTIENPKWKYAAISFIGGAEDQQTQQSVSNIVLEDENKTSYLDDDVILTPPAQRKTVAAKEIASTAAMQIAESMSAAVTVLKERRENCFDPNTTFCNYLGNELKTLKPEAAASVRKRVTIFFLECLEEERFKEICS